MPVITVYHITSNRTKPGVTYTMNELKLAVKVARQRELGLGSAANASSMYSFR